MEAHVSTLCHSQQLKLKSKQKPETQSINQLYQKEQGSTCNYCHKGLSYSWGLTAPNYQPYTYQTMMQRGWRRCGTYYYKLDLQKSCCKQWTHRLDVNHFKIKKDQKKTVKKMMAWCYEPVFEIQDQKHQHNVKKSKNQHNHNKSQHNDKNQNAKNHDHHKNIDKKQKVYNNDHRKDKNEKHSQQKTNDHNQKAQKPEPKSTKMIIELSLKTIQFITQICQRINASLQASIDTLIPKEKLNPQNLNKQWNLNCLDKLKCFPSKPQEKSDYYCNWGMLLYGVNKQKFIKDFSLVDFVKAIKEFVQKIQISKDYAIKLERGGYLLIELGDKLKDDKQFEIIKEVRQQKPQKMEIQKQILKNQNQQHLSFSAQTQQRNSQTNQKNAQAKQKTQMQLEEPPKIKKQQSSNKFQKLQPQFKGELVITSDLITFGKMKIHLVEAEESTESWKMYQRYCSEIHGKVEKGLSSYTNFLCQRALTYGKQEKKAKQGQKKYIPAFDPVQTHQKKRQITGTVTKRLGCYHMKYYYENKLIGVGVIDMLPNGLSSVYYFYQPQYKDHRLGVFSSLIQIEYVRYLSLTFPEFKYYYMGFYIHANQKMSYKGDYEPFQLLCPITYNFFTVDQRVWDIVNKVVKQGDKNIRLAPEGMPLDPDMHFTTDLGLFIDKNIKLSYRKKPLNLKDINPEFYLPVLILLKTYLKVFGKEVFDMLTFTF